jgi:hypothetical protein
MSQHQGLTCWQKLMAIRCQIHGMPTSYASITCDMFIRLKKLSFPLLMKLTSYPLKTYVFTRVAPRTKSKGLPIDGPLLSKNLCFYTLSTAYKKKGAPDRWSLTQQKLMFFTRVAPHTKSKGLPIDDHLFSKNLCFLHV